MPACARLETFFRHQVDTPAKQLLQKLLQVEVAVVGRGPLKLHQHVNIAFVVQLIPRGRSEQSGMAGMLGST